jgi:hypothetical protein
MSSLLERALGDDWSRLAPTLRAHCPSGPTPERGEMTVEFPPAMRAPCWCLSRSGHIVEFVNPYLGLELAPWVEGEGLRYRSVAYVLRLGRRQLTLPRWLTPGQASIVERAVDAEHYAMDFRLVHPLFGQVFRYSGVFATGAAAYHGRSHETATPIQRASDA